jgi:hypothetical protein
MRRIFLAAVAMLIPVSALAVVGLSGTAGAAGGKLVCTSITGNASSTIVVSGCTGGNTGGSSEPLVATSLETGGTTDWVSGSTTTTDAPVLTDLSAKKCPGYVKNAESNPSAIGFAFNVTADTGDGMMEPATGAGSVCVSTSGAITTLKALEYRWTPGEITCTGINGNAASTITVSGCTGGDTGGSSTSMTATTLATGGTVDWVSGSKTTIGDPTLTTSVGKKCPGYVKGAESNPTAEAFTAPVTSDSGDGLPLPGSASGAVCISSSGAITDLKPLVAK